MSFVCENASKQETVGYHAALITINWFVQCPYQYNTSLGQMDRQVNRNAVTLFSLFIALQTK